MGLEGIFIFPFRTFSGKRSAADVTTSPRSQKWMLRDLPEKSVADVTILNRLYGGGDSAHDGGGGG